MPSRFVAFAFLAASLCGASTPAPSAARLSGILRTLPVRFEENRGQWDPNVKFVARTGAYSLSLTANGAVVAAASQPKTPARQIAIAFPGSAPAAVEGVDPYPLRTNYFLGKRKSDWRTGIANYARVRYRQVYPGVDVVYYGNGEQLEYDFALAPGADAARIRMDFQGADRVSLTPSGDLAIEGGEARLLQKRPSVYQQDATGRREVAAHYKLLGANLVGVELGSYDPGRALTIDPVLYYGTLVGSTGTDTIVSVKVDSTGYVYVAGYSNHGDFGPSGFYQAAYNGGAHDVFIAKFDPNISGPTSMVYFTYLGGSSDDKASAMAIDNAGNAYITGTTNSSNFPVSSTAYQSALGGTSTTTVSSNALDAFVVKLNTTVAGTSALAYSTFLGGAGEDAGNAIDVDSAGNIYVGGRTRSDGFPTSASARAAVKWGTQDAFFSKIDPRQSGAASLLYSSYIGGELEDEVTAMAVGPNGQVYMAGNTTSTMYPLAGSYAFGPRGGTDIFISRLDLTKSGFDSVPYTTMYGGSGADDVKSMVVDAQGRLVLTGYTLSPDFPTTPGALARFAPGTAGNAFVARLDLSKPDIVDYSTYLGGSGGEVAYGVAVDRSGNILLTGYTLSSDFPVTPDAAQSAYTGGVSAFFTMFNPSVPGLKYSTYLGGSSVHTGFGVAAAQNGRMFVAGSAGITGVPLTPGAYKAAYSGGITDGFLLAFNP